jgi:hypothetical protein
MNIFFTYKNYFYKIIFLLLVCSISDSYAQQATAAAKKKEYLIGDWVPVDITVSVDINSKVYFPNFSATDSSTNGTIEVADVSSIDTVKDGTNYRYHQLVNFICFDTGQMLFEPFPIMVSSGGNLDTIYTDAVLVHVAGVEIDTTKDIKPIKDPMKVPYTFREIAPYLLGGLGVLALVAFLIWYFKFRKKKAAPLDLKYVLPPHIWAIQELDKVEKQKLWQNGEVKSYYSQLSDILRTYIELRFKVPAMEHTSDEIMQSLHKGILKQKLKQPIHNFLLLSDFVKFAKAQPDLNDNTDAIKTIKTFIEETKPAELNN